MEFWDDRLRRILAGRYELDRLLGRGGSSLVFLAEDLKLRRMVAIKVLRREVVACSGTDRFEREMRIAALLQHPHIVPLYDFENTDGMPYYVMPYVQAPTLWERIKGGARFDADDAISTVRAIASALDCAHQHGVTHRDVSPTNIFDHDGHALLFDFGIAVAKNEGADERPLTAPSHCLGTAHYMSPEQASGDAPADGRSDQYSLACVLYEMVTGRPPFVGTDHAVMTKHIHEQPVPLSRRAPEVDAGVCAAVTRALAKFPFDRFPTVMEFAGALTPRPPAPTIACSSIAVVPFACGDEGDGDELGGRMTDCTMDALRSAEGLAASRTSEFSPNGRGQATGDLTNVRHILEGSVRRHENNLRVSVQLVDADAEHPLWAGEYDRFIDAGLTVLEEIAADIASHLRARFATVTTTSCSRVA